MIVFPKPGIFTLQQPHRVYHVPSSQGDQQNKEGMPRLLILAFYVISAFGLSERLHIPQAEARDADN